MHQPLQINTLFRGFASVLSLVPLLGCEPWQLPQRECFSARATGIAVVASPGNSQSALFSLTGVEGGAAEVTWDFGDGKTQKVASARATVQHTYADAKPYEINATLTDPCGKAVAIPPASFSPEGTPKLDLTSFVNAPSGGLVCALKLLSTGNATLTRYGICYSRTQPNPTLRSNDGVVMGSNTLAAGTEQALVLPTPPLAVGEAYYLRAFAINAADTGYSVPTSGKITVLPPQ